MQNLLGGPKKPAQQQLRQLQRPVRQRQLPLQPQPQPQHLQQQADKVWDHEKRALSRPELRRRVEGWTQRERRRSILEAPPVDVRACLLR